ncbi:MAG: hypothetical protein QXV55_02435 [Acidilobaceae archaeon]
MSLRNAIEGWTVVVSRRGSLDFMVVRGYRHPDWGLIVSPYTIFSRRVKSYDFSWVEDILERVDCIGRRVPVARYSSVISYIDPEKALKVRRDELDSRVLELIDVISPEWSGLTGSWATFSENLKSDVDLLIYSDPEEVYKVLRDLREERSIAPCDLEKRAKKIEDLLDLRYYELISQTRLLDSCYKGYPYTLRVLRTLEREPCSALVYNLGRYEGMLRIKNALGAFAVPALYEVELIDIGLKAVLETWHTRFAELPKGFYMARVSLFEERGTLKTSPDIDGWMRLEVLEENQT